MYSYIIGIITSIEPANITLESHGIGYLVIVPNPYDFQVNNELKLFIYQHVREDELTLYGFKALKDKHLFMQLLSVKGIGPKSALAVMASANADEIVKAIESGDAKYLNRFPGIGPKASQQIILDLKGKIHLGPMTLSKANRISEVEDALKALGYRAKEINLITKKLDASKPTEALIKDALRFIAR